MVAFEADFLGDLATFDAVFLGDLATFDADFLAGEAEDFRPLRAGLDATFSALRAALDTRPITFFRCLAATFSTRLTDLRTAFSPLETTASPSSRAVDATRSTASASRWVARGPPVGAWPMTFAVSTRAMVTPGLGELPTGTIWAAPRAV